MAALRAMLQLRPGPTTENINQSNSLLSALSTVSSASTSTSTSPTHNTARQLQAAAVIASKRPVAQSRNLGLHSGAASGNLGLVKFALDNGQPIDSVFNGVLAIHAACCCNSNLPVVLFLIERGADVNSRRYPRKYSGERAVGAQTVGTTGSTPLHFAAANGCLPIVEILLRHGAIADLTDKYGSTPSSVAIARNHPEVASLLYQHACMQRGVQAIIPDTCMQTDSRELDPFTSPRSSVDFGRRLFPVASRLLSSPAKDISSRTVPQPAHIIAATPSKTMGPPSVNQQLRAMNHRRVSLPSIIESPSSPTVSTVARQSCDLGRIPLSAEPLHARSGSADARLPSPVPSMRSPPKGASNSYHPPTGRTLARLEAPTNNSRRRSIDVSASATLLSPKIATSVNRRRSLDQLSGQKKTTGLKARRQSNASNAETVVSSGQSSCSTLVTPLTMMNGNDSKTLLDNGGVSSDSMTPSSTSILGNGDAMASPSSSPMQPPAMGEHASKRRVISASEPGGSLVVQARERQTLTTAVEDIALDLIETEKKYRRRSMQDALWRSSSGSGNHNNNNSSSNSRITAKLTTSSSVSSLMQDSTAEGRVSSGKQHRKSGSSFSGSATISGRFSRFWSSALASGALDDKLKKDQDEDLFVSQLQRSFHSYHNQLAAHSSSIKTEAKWMTSSDMSGDGQDTIGRSKSAARAGVMNRLAGIWSRR
ncbi:uncharacterized protein EMPS_10058 [Entomortierella parvispora]|uniref:protein S-acyltransferase n=1 Tax=Entomortierella parvispora TaxID=205924 RepID=A0A9P3HJ71_9FUNG|nr:uncharacterized protein EMPS_10058 [Entomortierella parvispora]